VLAVDPANYNLTIDDGAGSITLYVYPATIYSGDAASLDQIVVGWNVSAQYFTSGNLAAEVDTENPGG
ncbi:MAG: hypothetical protein GY778_06410, partial [bacterium]|nr:hypothetical protein [bacterium]